MYCDFYNLSEKPFNVTPDPKFLYLNARYREALASLHYGITERKGFVTLIGEAGTGKTTILNRLLDQLDTNTRSVLIFNTKVTFEDILEFVFAEFELPVHSGKKLYMLQRLNAFLLDELRAGRNVALLIDEGQDLDFSVLEDLRLLSNLETAKEKILQIVLSGQPELEQKLASPALRQLRQRIAINCRLLPLSRDELSEYVEFRLRMAGCSDPKMFTRDGEDRVWHYSRGIPRLVNVVCDNALVIGYALGKRRITGDLVNEAAQDLLVAQGEPLAVAAPLGAPTPPPAGASAAPPVEVSSEPPPRPELSTPEAAAPPARRGVATWAIVGVVAAALAAGFISMGRGMFGQPESPAVQKPRVAGPIIRPGAEEEDPPPAVVGREVGPKHAERNREPAAGTRAIPEVVEPGTGGPRVEAPAAEKQVPAEKAAQDVAEAPADPAPRVGGALPRPEAAAPAPELIEPAHQGNPPPDHDLEAGQTSAGDDPPPARHSKGELKGEKAVVPPKPAAVPPSMPLATVEAESALANAAAPSKREAAEKPAAEKPAAEKPALEKPAAEKAEALAPPDPVEVASAAVEPRREDGTDHHGHEGPAVHDAAAMRLAGQQFDNVVVHDGDSITEIAIRKYGQASYTILDLLKLANPEVHDIDRISVGQKVQLPQLGEGFQVITTSKDAYGLLIYSTPVAPRAASLSEALRARGFKAEVAPATIGVHKTVYRVVVAPMASEAEAGEVGKHIQRAFREDDRLAQLGRY